MEPESDQPGSAGARRNLGVTSKLRERLRGGFEVPSSTGPERIGTLPTEVS
jgi:hypothetical protein